jgi:hypothetical protein
MRRTIPTALLLLILFACACDDPRGPRLSISTNPAATEATERATTATTKRGTTTKGPRVYGGKTAGQWAQDLQGNNREQVAEACRALHVLGREGREHLFQGLDSSNVETRRLCLQTLTIADFKRLSDSGRQKLVQLAGDHDDVRIRERAAALLQQWHGSIPAP